VIFASFFYSNLKSPKQCKKIIININNARIVDAGNMMEEINKSLKNQLNNFG